MAIDPEVKRSKVKVTRLSNALPVWILKAVVNHFIFIS